LVLSNIYRTINHYWDIIRYINESSDVRIGCSSTKRSPRTTLIQNGRLPLPIINIHDILMGKGGWSVKFTSTLKLYTSRVGRVNDVFRTLQLCAAVPIRNALFGYALLCHPSEVAISPQSSYILLPFYGPQPRCDAFASCRNPCSREKDRSPRIPLIAVGCCCHCLLLLSLTFQLNPPSLHSRWLVRRTQADGLLHTESIFSLRNARHPMHLLSIDIVGIKKKKIKIPFRRTRHGFMYVLVYRMLKTYVSFLLPRVCNFLKYCFNPK
jgi:hypothetical protein